MSMILSKDVQDPEKSGLVRLYPDEASNYANKLISTWEPKNDTLFLRYGSSMMGALSVAPAVMFGSKIRSVNKLHGLSAMKLPTTFISSLVAFGVTNIVHARLKEDLILGLKPCPVCLEVRGICLQLVAGIGTPWLLSAIGVNQFMQSTYRSTFSPFSKDFFVWYGRMFYKTRYVMFGNASVQAAGVSLLFVAWTNEWRYINQEMQRRAQEAEEFERQKF